ncbi:hypothetical protein BGZ63DRAFT_389503 [Mariannaea sp. PMI_226]|nr:hypothetical protein BGZ63DRAFT_389503 [Mariannaea sp. PMI_226]
MAPNSDIATRALVVTLKSPLVGRSTTEIAELTGLSRRTVNQIYARAVARGFDPDVRPVIIRNEYLSDAARSGRPPKQRDEEPVDGVNKVRCDRLGGNKEP